MCNIGATTVELPSKRGPGQSQAGQTSVQGRYIINHSNRLRTLPHLPILSVLKLRITSRVDSEEVFAYLYSPKLCSRYPYSPTKMSLKIAIVLGSGPNIGAATVNTFKDVGWKVAFASRSADENTRDENTMALRCDLTHPSSVTNVFDSVRRVWGEPSVVVYNGESIDSTRLTAVGMRALMSPIQQLLHIIPRRHTLSTFLQKFLSSSSLSTQRASSLQPVRQSPAS